MALAALGSVVGMLAGLLGLAVFGLGWLPALALWVGGGTAGVAGAVLLAALPRAPAPTRTVRRPTPEPQTA